MTELYVCLGHILTHPAYNTSKAGTCYSETGIGEIYKKGAPLVNKKHEVKKGSTQQKSCQIHTQGTSAVVSAYLSVF